MVKEYPGDTWVHPKNPIYPLKIQGEEESSKRKKMKMTLIGPQMRIWTTTDYQQLGHLM